MAIKDTTTTFCTAKFRLFLCTLSAGHAGPHAATGPGNELFAQWHDEQVAAHPTLQQLKDFAQYALSAVQQWHTHTLSPEAASLYGEWSRANEHARRLLADFDSSTSSVAIRRALGMLLRPQIAQDVAADEVYALLSQSDAIKEQLADGNWQPVAEVLTRACIGAYLAALVEAVR